jgi:hypothetical protein
MIVIYTFLTTLAWCVSAYLILNVGLEKALFQFVLLCIVLIAPLWKWLLQEKKEIIGGPWEIAKIESSVQS